MNANTPSVNRSGPVSESQRIASIDVLRGWAVLGILVMNIQSFAMPGAAYMNPTAFGEPSRVDWWIWVVGHVLFDRKFMTIFSMLFGAGIVLMTTRREEATGRSAGVHYRRMGILLLFGLAHAYLLWYGDVLYCYAMCGFVIFLFRRWRPGPLLILGLIAVAIPSAMSILFQWSMRYWPPEQLAEIREFWAPTDDMLASEVAAYRGAWSQQMTHRAASAFFMQTSVFLIEFVERAGGLMLIGMSLFKLDVFSAKRSSTFYIRLIAIALLAGIPIVVYGVYRNAATGWTLQYSFFLGAQFNYWASFLVSLGWVGLVMLICQRQILTGLTNRLAAVGRMALTNYLLQTVICTTIFYGHGLGQFDRIGRPGQLCIVAAVWLTQLLFSPVWLRRYRFGPMEWLWRSLTYMQFQPMQRSL